jgi:DNA mismatch endonuclease, patch repair protein
VNRSELMSRIRSKDTGPELIVAAALRSLRVAAREHDASLPGRPDFALHGRKTALFVDGCFWHGHSCQKRRPVANAAWWAAKLDANKRRDGRQRLALRAMGWRVAVVRECELRATDAVRLVARKVGIWAR